MMQNKVVNIIDTNARKTVIVKKTEMIEDYITGKQIPNIGAEENRQEFERFLIEEKGFLKEDIIVDKEISIKIKDEIYKSKIDLVIEISGTSFILVKCAAGSLGSRCRETISAARIIIPKYQIPYSVVTDGKTAIILDTVTGKTIDNGLNAVLSKKQAEEQKEKTTLVPYPEKKYEREKIIFRSYDATDVNVVR